MIQVWAMCRVGKFDGNEIRRTNFWFNVKETVVNSDVVVNEGRIWVRTKLNVNVSVERVIF